MSHRIICIGRQFGSGGHEIAVRVGQQLGIRVYEKDILHLACKYGDLAVKTLEGADEKATNPYFYQIVCEGNHHVTRGLPTSEVLFALQSHEIRRIAEQEDCIFVGRCADFVLKDTDARLLRVFVSAPFEHRVQRKMEQEQLSYRRAAHLVKRMDRQRARYREHYTGRPWGDPDSCDLVLDTGAATIDQAVAEITARYEVL